MSQDNVESLGSEPPTRPSGAGTEEAIQVRSGYVCTPLQPAN
jgi:hypothetical protein